MSNITINSNLLPQHDYGAWLYADPKDSFETKIKYMKLRDNAHEPTRGSAAAAGYDVYAAINDKVVIKPGQTKIIGTGIAIAPPDNTFMAIFARSGLSIKRGLRLANGVAIIDSDYRGEYLVALHNDSNKKQTINPGERIAQIVLIPYLPMKFNEVEELDSTERGTGGLGSTGV
jgi:dUTP pyrophosphatase